MGSSTTDPVLVIQAMEGKSDLFLLQQDLPIRIGYASADLSGRIKNLN